MILARGLKAFFQIGLAILTRQQISGRERIPDPPYIMAINHLGVFDVPLIYGQFGGPRITGWAAEKWEHHWVYGTILRSGGAIFIHRGKVDRRAIERAVVWLQSGNAFAMAPEGTRSATGAMARAKTGIAYLVDQADVPVIPCAITGPEKVAVTLRRLGRPLLTATVGEPFKLPPLPEHDRTPAMRSNTDALMCRIAAMLPPAYRGYYADFPLTRALLESGYGDEPIEANAPSNTDIAS
ncbi:MAG: lysophospholipid acyltransferase family protein [Anaerolineales bacterium]